MDNLHGHCRESRDHQFLARADAESVSAAAAAAAAAAHAAAVYRLLIVDNKLRLVVYA